MENKKTPYSCSSLTVVFLILAIGAGIERHNFWVGLCAFFALQFTGLAFDVILNENAFPLIFWGSTSIGLTVLVYRLAHYAPKFSWVGACLVVIGLAYVVAGWSLFSQKSLRSWFGFIIEMVGFAAISYAFGWNRPTPAQVAWRAQFASWNVWAILLVVADLFVAIWIILAADGGKGGTYLLASLLSVALVGGASWITASKPTWIWIVFWVLNGLAILGSTFLLNKWPWRKKYAAWGIVLGIASTVAGIVVPIYLDREGGIPLLATLQTIQIHWKDMWDFLWGLILSVWGAVYLVFLFICTQRWIRRVGGLLALILLLGWVGFLGLADPRVAAVQEALTSSLSGALNQILLATQAQYGSAALGIAAVSVFTTVLMIPIFNSAMKMSRFSQQLSKLQAEGAIGNSTMNNMISQESKLFVRGLLDWLLVGVVSGGITIALWIALHGLADKGTIFTFPLIGIPDLSLPNWKPVWEFRYFILPIVLGVSMYLPSVIYRWFKAPSVSVPLWASILVYLFVGLFIPAGVMIYFIAQSLTQIIIIPISLMGKRDRTALPAVLGVPIPVSPYDGSSQESRSVTFSWRAGQGAVPAGYNLVVDSIPYSTAATNMELSLNVGTHTWQVQAISPGRSSEFSVPRSLNIVKTVRAPGAPAPLSPADGSTIAASRVVFSWEAGAGRNPSGYILEVDGKVFQTTDTSLELPLNPGSHAWRIQAFFDDKYSDYTALWTLQVAAEKEAVYRHKNPVADLVVTDQGEVLFLDTKGLVYTFQDNKASKVTAGGGSAPVGLALASENRMAVVRKDGQIELSARAGGTEPQVISVKYPIAHFAVNRFGTKLVYSAAPTAGASTEVVWDFNLLNQKETKLSEHAGEVTALAFLENQFLAAGTQAGEIDVINVSNRSLINCPAFAEVDQSGVSLLAAGPAGQWIALYENGVIAHWNQRSNSGPEDQLKTKQKVTCLCVDVDSGSVACGEKGGGVQVFPLDLGAPIFSREVFSGDVVKLAFLKGGEALVGVSKDGVIQKIDL